MNSPHIVMLLAQARQDDLRREAAARAGIDRSLRAMSRVNAAPRVGWAREPTRTR